MCGVSQLSSEHCSLFCSVIIHTSDKCGMSTVIIIQPLTELLRALLTIMNFRYSLIDGPLLIFGSPARFLPLCSLQ